MNLHKRKRSALRREPPWRDERYADCPGEGVCHGPASWCAWCGDVDRVCDMTECHAHQRVGGRVLTLLEWQEIP